MDGTCDSNQLSIHKTNHKIINLRRTTAIKFELFKFVGVKGETSYDALVFPPVIHLNNMEQKDMIQNKMGNCSISFKSLK